MKFARRPALAAVMALVLVPGVALVGASTAAAATPVPVPPGVAPDADGQPTGPVFVAPSLRAATGPTDVVVQLARPSLAESVGEGAITSRTLPTRAQQRATLAAVKTDQDRVASAARSLGAREKGRVSKGSNSLVLRIDAKRIPALSKVPGVASVRPLGRYRTLNDPGASGSLEQASAYLQADPVRAQGYDGTGVRVAVLDSGIDFTHANLGGPGTVAAYSECYAGNAAAVAGPCADLFGPAAPKVKGGYDFVGETWPNAPEAPDPNPIDAEGHGTHVSDIIGGNSATHKGMAPGVSLYGVKVCSAVSSSCSGLALLQGVDWALDPNGDGDISDAVDLMNLSLGSDYGQDEDDLSFALDNAVRAGVVVVASAGNGGDRPFKVGSPSIAARVISVAQTALPDEKSFIISVTSPANVPGLLGNQIRLTVLQPWGGPIPATPGLVGDLARPTGSPLGCNASDFGVANAGKVALVTRGSCAISIKAGNAQAAGATGMILVNNTGGAPGAFSYGGGGTITIPVLAVSQGAGNALVTAVGAGTVSVQVDPAQALPLSNTMVASSSRGPSIDGTRVKPDIGAPGAWLSAEVGTGGEETNFGGTSGAAPTVSGVAALLLQKFPNEQPAAVKTRLLNGADTYNKTPDLDGVLYPTPVSRIGAGEVRAFTSAGGTFRLRSRERGAGSIALGALSLSSDRTITRTVDVTNLTNASQRITLAPSFRDPADQALGAVVVTGGGTFTVPAKGTVSRTLSFRIKAAKLATWPLTGRAGVTGGDGTVLNGPELDGNLVATNAGGEAQHLGWHVLPHRAADVAAPATVNLKRVNTATVKLTNASKVLDGGAEVFALTGSSAKLPMPAPGAPGSPGSNVAQVDVLSVGVRDAGSGVLQFAIVGGERRATPLYPAGYEVDIDANRDGTADYAVFQQEIGGFGGSGQSVVYVQNLAGGAATAYFYSSADYSSGNIVYTVPASALGLSAGQAFDFDLVAYDNYFSGAVTDAVSGMTYTPSAPRFGVRQGGSAVTSLVVPKNGSQSVSVSRTGSASPSTESGVLFLYDDAAGKEATAVVAKN